MSYLHDTVGELYIGALASDFVGDSLEPQIKNTAAIAEAVDNNIINGLQEALNGIALSETRLDDFGSDEDIRCNRAADAADRYESADEIAGDYNADLQRFTDRAVQHCTDVEKLTNAGKLLTVRLGALSIDLLRCLREAEEISAEAALLNIHTVIEHVEARAQADEARSIGDKLI